MLSEPLHQWSSISLFKSWSGTENEGGRKVSCEILKDCLSFPSDIYVLFLHEKGLGNIKL